MVHVTEPSSSPHGGSRTFRDDEPVPRDLVRAQVHRLTQSLWDTLPDDVVGAVLRQLASSQVEDALAVLDFALRRHRPAVTLAEFDVLEECLELLGLPTDTLDVLDPVDAERSLAADLDPGPHAGGRALDTAVLRRLSQVEGLLGGWRAWRRPAPASPWLPVRPMYVFETVDAPTAFTVLERFHGADAPEQDALVDAYETGGEPSEMIAGFHVLGALVHLGVAPPPFRVADLFDGVAAPGTAPAGLQVVPADQAEELSARLRGGRRLLTVPRPGIDLLDTGNGAAVPLHLRTDGTWIWCEGAAYYLDVHRVAPVRDLLAHLRREPGPAGHVPDVVIHLALEWLRRAEAEHGGAPE